MNPKFDELRARIDGEGVLIAAPGTSCRYQITDGTITSALHPAEVLYNALN